METEKAVATQNKPWLWKKGQSGNPLGMKKGTKHFQTLFKDAVTKVAAGNAESDDVLIVKRVIQDAKNGNYQAIKTVLDRVDGDIREETKDFTGLIVNVITFNGDINPPQLEA